MPRVGDDVAGANDVRRCVGEGMRGRAGDVQVVSGYQRQEDCDLLVGDNEPEGTDTSEWMDGSGWIDQDGWFWWLVFCDSDALIKSK